METKTENAHEPAVRESRVKKTLLNARVNLIFYFLTLALSFFSRKIFLDCLGANFVGLTGTLQNLLGFLNLAELGIGSAIGYLLYKPLYDHDETKINEIISVMGYLYRWIGIIILGAGCVLACFLPLIFPKSDTGFSLSLIYFAYFSFLASSLIGYFINYRQNLLGADQRNYVVTGYFQTAMIVKTLIQMTLAYYTRNLYLWVVIEFLFGILFSIILNWKINQTYPWLKSEVRLGKQLFRKYPEVMVKTRQLFVHKLGTFVQYQTMPFLIYTFVSLKIVAFYGNYTIIVDKISQMISNLLGSVGASVGNLIAEGNKEKSYRIFWELFALRIIVASTVVFALYELINPFVSLWLGVEYLLPDIVIDIMLINVFIGFSRGTTDTFLFGYGLFQDTWAPLVECAIYIVVAIFGGMMWGLPGVLLGPTISMIVIIMIWKPYFLFRSGFEKPQRLYWMNFTKYVAVSAVAMILAAFIGNRFIDINPSDSYTMWVVYASVTVGLFFFVEVVLMYATTRGTRDLFKRFLCK